VDTYFTADTHFGHVKIAEFCPRRKELGDTVEQRDEAIITRWNAVVRPIDRVYFLGDLTFYKERSVNERILDRLHGMIHLFPGNHDSHILPYPFWGKGRFTIRPTLVYERVGITGMVLCHYPLIEWQNSFHGAYMLHGHSHHQHPESMWRRMDVGIDAHPEMRPWSLTEIRAKLEPRPFQDERLYKEDPA
jgi:calcineurin-like phosphoesterase family protein